MISFTVNPDDERRLFLHLDELPTKLLTELKPTITSLTDELLRRIHAAEPVRTGQLRAQTQAFVDQHDDRIIGRVRVVAGKGRMSGTHEAAAALEYGAHRSFLVREHTTHHLGSDRTISMVEAYQRRADITAKRFMRDPAEAMRPRILSELQEAVNKVK